MNKHDKLTVAARDMAGQENCDGPEYDMIIELTDLLQLYGDALVQVGDESIDFAPVGDTPDHYEWHDVLQAEINAIHKFAQKTVGERNE